MRWIVIKINILDKTEVTVKPNEVFSRIFLGIHLLDRSGITWWDTSQLVQNLGNNIYNFDKLKNHLITSS